MNIGILVLWSLKLAFEVFYNFPLTILVGKSRGYWTYRPRLKTTAKFQKEHNCKRYAIGKKSGIVEG